MMFLRRVDRRRSIVSFLSKPQHVGLWRRRRRRRAKATSPLAPPQSPRHPRGDLPGPHDPFLLLPLDRHRFSVSFLRFSFPFLGAPRPSSMCVQRGAPLAVRSVSFLRLNLPFSGTQEAVALPPLAYRIFGSCVQRRANPPLYAHVRLKCRHNRKNGCTTFLF